MKDAKAVMEEVKRMKKESKLKKKFLKLENKRKHLGNETAPWHVVDCCIVLWCILKSVLFSAKIASRTSHVCSRKKLQKKLKKQTKGKGEKDDESSSSSSSTSSLSEATQARLRKDNLASNRSWCSKTCLANQHILWFYHVLPTFDK